MLLDPLNASKKSLEIFASMSGDKVNRSVAEEKKVRSNLAEERIQKVANADGRPNQIDLVHDDDARLVILLDQPGDLLVLGGDPFDGVNDQRADIGPSNAFFRTHHAENFDGGIVFTPRPNSRGVNQDIVLSIAPVWDVDGIPCCYGRLADDGALMLQNRIDQRGFTNVRPSDDRELNRNIVLSLWLLEGN